MADDLPSPDGFLGTAAVHATKEVPTAGVAQTAGQVRAWLEGRYFRSADDVAVLEGELLLGLVPIERLLAAPPEVAMAELMDPDPPIVAPGAHQELVAWKMVEHHESSIAVVDAEGHFAGLVSPHRMISVLLSEHDEDMARLGGYLAGTRVARHAAEESVARRLWHRLPWLLVGLLGAMASALIVGAFEEQLDRKVLLAFFVPGVVYMADAVGTQTETLLIRGLAVGFDRRRVIRRELLTGVAVGGIIAAAFLPFSLLVWGDGGIAVAVALALLASCSIATVVAMALPFGLQRLGRDPAFGSGPVATVVQDLLSIGVYFAIAIPLAT